jgi:hypothetical protein
MTFVYRWLIVSKKLTIQMCYFIINETKYITEEHNNLIWIIKYDVLCHFFPSINCLKIINCVFVLDTQGLCKFDTNSEFIYFLIKYMYIGKWVQRFDILHQMLEIRWKILTGLSEEISFLHEIVIKIDCEFVSNLHSPCVSHR